jgi:hypothetical protein
VTYLANIVYRPRSATEILDASFHLLRQNYATFVILTAVAYMPLAVAAILFRRYTGLTPGANPEMLGWNVILVLPVQFIWFTIMTGIVATLASRAYVQDPLDPGSTWKVIVPRLPVIIVSAIIVAVGSVIGFIFLFFPGFYFWTRFGMAPLIAALEGTSINDSFARATHLSHGQKLHIFGTMLLAIVLYFIVELGVGIAFTMLPTILLQTALGYLSTILIWPLLPMIQTALYYDLRIRAEGYDVDLMSRTLGPVAGTPAEAIV